MSKFIPLFLFLVLQITSACSSANKYANGKELAQVHLQIGTRYLTERNYPSALKELLEAEKYDSNDPIIQNNLGLAYYVRADFEKAKLHLKKAISLDPKYGDARSNYGRLLLDTGHASDAVEEFKSVVNDLTYPQPEKAKVNLGIAYLSVKKYKDAEKAFVSAIELNKNYCPAYIFLGRSFYDQNEFARAAKRLDQAVAVCKNEGFDEPQYFSAMAYMKLGEKEKAIARLEEIVDLTPKSAYAEKSRQFLKSLDSKETNQ